jgi:hypothetical protein
MAEPFNLQTGAVRLAPKQQYFNLVMDTHAAIVEVCKTDTVDTGRLRIGMIVRALIAQMPSQEIQDEYNTLRNEKLKEVQTTYRNDAAERSNATFEINLDIAGKIMILMDQMIGLVDRQSIMLGNASEGIEEYEYSDEMPIMEVKDDE